MCGDASATVKVTVNATDVTLLKWWRVLILLSWFCYCLLLLHLRQPRAQLFDGVAQLCIVGRGIDGAQGLDAF